MRKAAGWSRWARIGLALLVLLAAAYYGVEDRLRSPSETLPADASALRSAYEQQRSGVWVTVTGRVTRLLADDNDGSRHQRFVVEVTPGHTVLVAHNIDLAERVPLRRGDEVDLRGRYEWNAKGGVLHWTHHDPQGRHAGGWVQWRGQRFY